MRYQTLENFLTTCLLERREETLRALLLLADRETNGARVNRERYIELLVKYCARELASEGLPAMPYHKRRAVVRDAEYSLHLELERRRQRLKRRREALRTLFDTAEEPGRKIHVQRLSPHHHQDND